MLCEPGFPPRSNWADCFPMVHARHLEVVMQMVVQLEGDPQTPSLGAAPEAARQLVGSVVSNLPHGGPF